MSNDKTYRIKNDIAEKIRKIHLEYMKKNEERISETKIANAIMCIGLDEKNEKKIAKHLEVIEEMND